MSRGRDTQPELALRRELWGRGRRYRIDYPLPLVGVRRRADIAFPSYRLAVLVDGCYWHVCPEHGTDPRTNAPYWSAKLRRNVERDRETDQLAHDTGWRLLRVWEHEHPVDAADRVEGALRERARS